MFPAVIIIIALVVGVVYLLQKKAKTPYKIIVLGHSLAGKTVLLASMNYKLSIQDPKVGFLLNLMKRTRFNGTSWMNTQGELQMPGESFRGQPS